MKILNNLFKDGYMKSYKNLEEKQNIFKALTGFTVDDFIELYKQNAICINTEVSDSIEILKLAIKRVGITKVLETLNTMNLSNNLSKNLSKEIKINEDEDEIITNTDDFVGIDDDIEQYEEEYNNDKN